jgi:hypothetical protein
VVKVEKLVMIINEEIRNERSGSNIREKEEGSA